MDDSLRSAVVKAIAWQLYTPDCEPVAPADFCPACGQEAERILDDAVLDVLADRADEWAEAGSDAPPALLLARLMAADRLIAVLRGDTRWMRQH